jgi:asparagine synthase (glutamine-hydrolysing)
MFKKIDGIFNITIYDKKEKKLYIAKDKVGEEPLYIYQDNYNFAFSNKLRNFYTISSFNKKINIAGLASFLEYGYVLESDSIFENVYKVKSGHYIEYNFKNKNFKEIEYWCIDDFYQMEKFDLSEKEIIDSVEILLHKSINKRLNNSRSIALSLSGGFDSSTIATLLSQQSSKKIDTFTIGFYDKKINEAPYAKKLANYLGTNHHEIYFDEKEAIDIIPNLFNIYDEPFADQGAVASVLLAQSISNNNKNSYFAGDGADRIFGTFRTKTRFSRVFEIHPYIRKFLYTLLSIINIKAISYLSDYKDFSYRYEKMLLILGAKTIPEMVKIRDLQFLQTEVEKLLKQKITSKNTFDMINNYPNIEYLDEILRTDFKTFLKGIELTKSYGSSQKFGLKVLKPYLDIELIEYIARVPQSIKIKNNISKYILKEILYKNVPKELMNRPKSGFSIPIEKLMKGIFKELLYEELSPTNLKNDGIFDVKSVIEIRDKFYKGVYQKRYKLWYLFIFQLWYHNTLKIKHISNQNFL